MRPHTKISAAGAVAFALIAGALLGGRAPASAPTPPTSPGELVSGALDGVAARGGAGAVARLEEASTERPQDADVLAALGVAYQIRWRETGDASYLSRSGAALQAALQERPADAATTLGLGNLALIRHRFRNALALGREARALAPHAARPYGVIGDALLELGRYREAFAAFDRMTALKPSLASYARVAYARELAGDTRGAIAAMELARDASGGQPEPTAWVEVELGKLELGRGRLAVAAGHLRAALAIAPGYVSALEQMARVEAARGNLARATAIAGRAAETVPLPQLVALLGDLLERSGRLAEARRQYATVAAIEKLLVANGVRVDLESAVYRADHAIRPAETVALARKARAGRPSIYGDDALGWALARAGRCAEGLRWTQRALRLGTRDALLWFHRGYAAGCAGDVAGMRRAYATALSIDPGFSVRWARVARKGIS